MAKCKVITVEFGQRLVKEEKAINKELAKHGFVIENLCAAHKNGKLTFVYRCPDNLSKKQEALLQRVLRKHLGKKYWIAT